MDEVVIGMVTYKGHLYCRDQFFAFLKTLTYKKHSFVIVTNSDEHDKKDIEERAKKLKKATVIADTPSSEYPYDIIVSGRNKVADHFLKTKAKWLLMLNTDIVGPKNMIEVLLSNKKELVTGYYLNYYKDNQGKEYILPVVYGLAGGRPRQLRMDEVFTDQLIPIVAAGLGCCLIHRSVLEKVEFRCDHEQGTPESASFYLDALKIKKQPYLDTRVACWHLKFPPEDKRNIPLDPRRYKVAEKRS